MSLVLLGRHAEAEIEFRNLVAIRKRVLGDHHPDTIVAWKILSLDAVGQNTEADQERQKLRSLGFQVDDQ